MNKKVLYVSGAIRVSTHHSSSAGGPRAHILGIIDSFRSLGWQVKEFIAGNQIPENIQEKDTGSKLKESLFLRMASDAIRLILRFIYRLKSMKVIGSEKVDLVYERYAAYQEIGSYVRKKTGALWVLETNGLYYYEAYKERKAVFFHSILRRLEIKAYRKCDFLICISQHLKDLIVSKLEIDPNKILVTPNGVNLDVFDSSKYKKRPNKIFKIGFIGTLILYQRLDVLIHACAILKAKKIFIEVEIVGDGPELESWRELAEDLEVENQIHFQGKKAWGEIPEIISTFDLGYSVPDPSLAGKYVSPLKMYEYMAMEVPTLAYPTEDAKTLISSDTGFLVGALDPQDISEKIEVAMAADLRKMGKKCRTLIKESHSWDQRLSSILQEISNR